LYKDKLSELAAQAKKIKEIRWNSRTLTEIDEELDVVKISRSLMELKLYVSYLMDKDNLINEDMLKNELREDSHHLEEEKKLIPPDIKYPTSFSRILNKKSKGSMKDPSNDKNISKIIEDPPLKANDEGASMIFPSKIPNPPSNPQSRDPTEPTPYNPLSNHTTKHTPQSNPTHKQPSRANLYSMNK